jgi:hypothetical protein
VLGAGHNFLVSNDASTGIKVNRSHATILPSGAIFIAFGIADVAIGSTTRLKDGSSIRKRMKEFGGKVSILTRQ